MNLHAQSSIPWVLVVLLSCSPASVGAGVDAGPSAQQACADSAYARCNHLLSCSHFALELRYGDVPTCEASYRASCLQILAAPGTVATPAGAETCAQKIADWACVDFIDGVNPPPECTSDGTLPAGAPCEVQSQCQTGFCAIAPGNKCGLCAAPPKPNDSCQSLTNCGPGLSCQYATQRCAAFGAVGAQCTSGLPCQPGLGCAGYVASTNTPGTCQPAVTMANASCDPKGAGCDFFSGLTCNTVSSTCVPIVLAAGGQPCGYVGDQNQVCGEGGRCINSMSGVPGTCEGAAGPGAACDLVKGPLCLTPSRCITAVDGGTSGTCQVPDPEACR